MYATGATRLLSTLHTPESIFFSLTHFFTVINSCGWKIGVLFPCFRTHVQPGDFPGRQKWPISANLLLSLFAAIVEQQTLYPPLNFNKGFLLICASETGRRQKREKSVCLHANVSHRRYSLHGSNWWKSSRALFERDVLAGARQALSQIENSQDSLHNSADMVD